MEFIGGGFVVVAVVLVGELLFIDAARPGGIGAVSAIGVPLFNFGNGSLAAIFELNEDAI